MSIEEMVVEGVSANNLVIRPQPSVQQTQNFELTLQQAQTQLTAQAPDEVGLRNLLQPLANLNQESDQLGAKALAVSAKDAQPSDLLLLIYQTHELMFRTQLTANVANRSSDGVQQLFRQQS